MTLNRCLTRNLGASNTNGHDRRHDHHRIVAGFSYPTRNKAEGTLNNIEDGFTGAFLRVIHQIVNDHSAVFTKHKGGVIDKPYADNPIFPCLNNVSEKYFRSSFSDNTGSIQPCESSATLESFDFTD